MGESHRIDDGHDLVRLAHLADHFGDRVELIDRYAGDARHHLRRVARVVLGHELPNGPRILERLVALRGGLRCARGSARNRLALCLVRPGRGVVRARGTVVSGEETVIEVEALLHDE